MRVLAVGAIDGILPLGLGGAGLSSEAIVGGIIGAVSGALATMVCGGWLNLARFHRKKWLVKVWHALEGGIAGAHYSPITGVIVGIVLGETIARGRKAY